MMGPLKLAQKLVSRMGGCVRAGVMDEGTELSMPGCRLVPRQKG